jgi:hypothetical protein
MDRNGAGQEGTRREYRLPSIPGGYEVRARFCWEFRTARRGFDSRRRKAHPHRAGALRRALAARATRLLLSRKRAPARFTCRHLQVKHVCMGHTPLGGVYA